MYNYFLIIIYILSIPSIIYGQWKSLPLRSAEEKALGFTGGEGFQNICSITYSQSNPKIVYLSTDTSKIWKSFDGGNTWKQSSNGFLSYGAISLAVNPYDSNNLYAAGFVGDSAENAGKYSKRHQGIYKTIDGGLNWTFIYKCDFYKQYAKGNLILFDKDNNDILYVGSYDKGLLVSTDGGYSWNSWPISNEHINDIKIDYLNKNSIFVATNTTLYRFSQKSGFVNIGKSLPKAPYCISTSKNNPNLLFLALGYYGVYASINNGINFFKIDSLPYSLDFTDIAQSQINANILYLKGKHTSTPPLYSTDAGKSWLVSEHTNLPDLGKEVGFWNTSPITPHPTHEKVALLGSNGYDRVLQTQDNGKSWQYSAHGLTGARMENIAFVSPNEMYLSLTDFGVWHTEDNGNTFKSVPISREFGELSSSAIAVQGNTFVTSIGDWSKKCLKIRTGDSNPWQSYCENPGLYKDIFFHTIKSNVIYAGHSVSVDSGQSWRNSQYTIQALYPNNNDIVYSKMPENAGTYILKSIDQGYSWTSTYPLLKIPNIDIRKIVVFPNDQNRLLVGTTYGLWSLNNNTWKRLDEKHGLIKDFFGESFIQDIAIDPNHPNRIFIGRRNGGYGESNGVFRSCDSGNTWTQINGNLGDALTVWSVKISPFNGDLYIGTSLGIFRLEYGNTLDCPARSIIAPKILNMNK